jgi:hypothetical protein
MKLKGLCTTLYVKLVFLLKSMYNNAKTYEEVLGGTYRLLSFDTMRTAYKTTRPTILLFLSVYSLPH